MAIYDAMATHEDTTQCVALGEICQRSDRRACVRLQPRLDVVRFGARTNDAQTNGFVVLELKVQYRLDDGLTHCQPVLSFAFFDNAQASSGVVVGQKSVQGQRDFHRAGNPNDVPDHEFEPFRFFDSERQHALDLVPMKGSTNQTDSLAHASSTSFILFEHSLHGRDHCLRHRIDLDVDAVPDLDRVKGCEAKRFGNQVDAKSLLCEGTDGQ